MSQLATVFALNRKGFRPVVGVLVASALLVPLFASGSIDHNRYYLSISFAVLFVALSDPGGDILHRMWHLALFGAIGAALTAIGFGIGGGPWGFVVLAAFVVTLLGGLSVRLGVHSFIAATLLNYWFVIVVALAANYDSKRIHINGWSQALAWLGGAGLWIAITCIVWLARGRRSRPEPVLPGDASPTKLTRPMIAFALIRAVALAGSVAIAFGLHLPNADWMPIATLVAIKPSLEQSNLVAMQRVAGAIIGAAVAAIVLLTLPYNLHVFEGIILVLAALAAAVRAVNYAYYTAAIAGAVLIGIDLPHPGNFQDEFHRVLFTFIGVGIGVVVMLLANLLQKHAAKQGAVASHEAAGAR